MKTRIVQYFIYNKTKIISSTLVLVFALTILILSDSTIVALSDARDKFEMSNPIIMTINANRAKFFSDYPDISDLSEEERIEIVTENLTLHKTLIKSLNELDEVKIVESYKTRPAYLTPEFTVANLELISQFDMKNTIKAICMSNSDLIDLYTNKSKLVSGEFISKQHIINKEYVTVINQEFAKVNNLKVGDELEVYLIIGQDPVTLELIKSYIKLSIVGIIQTTETTYNILEGSYGMLENTIYVPEFIGTENPYSDLDSNIDTINNIYFVIDGVNDEDFTSNNQNLLRSEYMEFSSNTNSINRAISLIEIPKLMAKIINVYTMIILVIVIISIELYSLNYRNHEFGILIATGLKKSELIAQLFIEKAITLTTSIIISIIISVILMPLYENLQFDSMMEDSSNMSKYYEEEQYIKDPINRYSIVDYDEIYTSMTLSININSVLKVVGIVSITLALNIVIFTNIIIRIKPKEIFNNL